jgi:sulfite reductase (NADPH) flavoprotein alpha-component
MTLAWTGGPAKRLRGMLEGPSVTTPTLYTARRPFAATRTGGHRLTPAGAPKETWHQVISLAGSGIAYRPGDSLGVCARNADALVDAIVERLGASGDEPVPAGQTETLPFREALARAFDLDIVSRRLLEACLVQGAGDFGPLLQKGAEPALKQYLRGWDEVHDVLDVLTDAPGAQFAPAEFVGLLRPLQPRLYSIASSQRVHPDEVHLLVLSVAYRARGRTHLGVGSTFVNDRWPLGTRAPIYVQDAQKHFAMPADPATPMIMIGPGTGLAPFRGFMEERDAIGAAGRNWLFFGDQSRSWGYYYEPELTGWQRQGRLRIDLAFSRDQPHKIYVQHRMREQARDLYAWLEEGAEVFICGDKARMAADVQRELQLIVELEGGVTSEGAAVYMAELKKSRRLKLDVY